MDAKDEVEEGDELRKDKEIINRRKKGKKKKKSQVLLFCLEPVFVICM